MWAFPGFFRRLYEDPMELGVRAAFAGYGIFIPMFFIKAGADLNASLGEVDVGFVALLAVLSFVVKIVPVPRVFRNRKVKRAAARDPQARSSALR